MQTLLFLIVLAHQPKAPQIHASTYFKVLSFIIDISFVVDSIEFCFTKMQSLQILVCVKGFMSMRVRVLVTFPVGMRMGVEFCSNHYARSASRNIRCAVPKPLRTYR